MDIDVISNLEFFCKFICDLVYLDLDLFFKINIWFCGSKTELVLKYLPVKS